MDRRYPTQRAQSTRKSAPTAPGTAFLESLQVLVLAIAMAAMPTRAPAAETNAGKIRVVDLYRAADGKPGAVDVYRVSATAGTKPTATLPFGQASDYLPVATSPSHLLFYPAGERAESRRLFDLNMQQEVGPGTPVSVAGEQVTVIVGPRAADSPGAASVSVVREWSSSRFALYAPKAGIAIVVGWAGAVQRAAQQPPPAFRFGLPGRGCLRHLMPGEDTVTATQFSPFEAPKGTPSIAIYPAADVRCSGPPLAAHAVPTFQQGRTFVFVHGPDPGHIDLLALPIPYPEE